MRAENSEILSGQARPVAADRRAQPLARVGVGLHQVGKVVAAGHDRLDRHVLVQAVGAGAGLKDLKQVEEFLTLQDHSGGGA